MANDLHIARCAFCGADLPPTKATGRPRLYCDDACKAAAFRNRRASQPYGPDIDPKSLSLPAAASSDEQIARAILEGRNLGAAFLHLSTTARAPFVGPCHDCGTAILAALDRNFGDA